MDCCSSTNNSHGKSKNHDVHEIDKNEELKGGNGIWPWIIIGALFLTIIFLTIR